MKFINNLLNNLNNSYSFMLNTALISTILILIQMLFIYDLSANGTDIKTINLMSFLMIAILFFRKLKKQILSFNYEEIGKQNIKSKLNIIFIFVSMIIFSYSILFTFFHSFLLNIIFFTSVIALFATISIVSDKYSYLMNFLQIYYRYGIPAGVFKVSFLEIEFTHNDLKFTYKKSYDALIVDNYRISELAIKSYLNTNNLKLENFNSQHLNILKILNY